MEWLTETSGRDTAIEFRPDPDRGARAMGHRAYRRRFFVILISGCEQAWNNLNSWKRTVYLTNMAAMPEAAITLFDNSNRPPGKSGAIDDRERREAGSTHRSE
jgi:hypothetical protein